MIDDRRLMIFEMAPAGARINHQSATGVRF
jgi:hypothetical protein